MANNSDVAKPPRPLRDPPTPPLQDPPSKPLHDPAGDPTYEPPQPVTEPTPNPAGDPPPEMPGDPVKNRRSMISISWCDGISEPLGASNVTLDFPNQLGNTTMPSDMHQ